MLCRLGNRCICFSFHDATEQWSSNFTVRNFSSGEKVSFQDQGYLIVNFGFVTLYMIVGYMAAMNDLRHTPWFNWMFFEVY